MMLPAPLAPLAAYRQFILCKLVPLPSGKTDKIPVSPNTLAEGVNAHDQANWSDYDSCAAIAATLGYSVAFALTANDPFFCLDVDGAVTSSGAWSPLVADVSAALPGAACELSQSGKGLHFWGRYTSIPEHRCKPPSDVRKALAPMGGLELYHEGRFICLGGHAGTIGDASTDMTAALPAVIARWFTPTAPAATPTHGDGPDPEWRGPTDDDELIRRMLASRPSAGAAFGSRATITELWNGDEAALARYYPSSTDDVFDRSSADAALASHLAFWTGKDAERMERLMRRSALMRDKYDRDDYLPARTIPNAIGQCTAVYQERQMEAPGATVTAAPAAAASRLADGYCFCWPDDQLKLWSGFVYVAEDDRILTTNGEMLNESRFKAKYGGLCYVMDAGNEKRTDNAWEAFIHSKAVRHPKVDRSTFRPDLEPRAVFEHDGLTFVNTYRPVGVRRVAGDPTPFLDHMRRLFTDTRDYDIVLNYLAALVQYRGHKFNWALFIQGTHGNGKSLLSLCVKAAIGDVYCHMPRADGLTAEYNDWLARTIFCGVEDVYLPTGRIEMMEILKPMITLEYQPIRAMRVSQTMKRVCTNFILNSNHKDGIRKTDEDRRFAPIFCAQQEREHKLRDGLTPLYFKRLYHWLEREDGYAIVADMLHTHVIPEAFGLTYLKGDAPVTSSTQEAVALSAGPVDAEVMEAVAAHRPGFCGGWISSLALEELLRERRMEQMCPRSKRPDMLKRLGYVHHPQLYNGRVTRALTTGQRPVLYIKRDHPNGIIKDGAAITGAFEKAQMTVAFDTSVDKNGTTG